MKRSRTIVLCVCCLIVALDVSLFAQEGTSFVKITPADGQQMPKSLLTRISVDLEDVPLEKAFLAIEDKGNFKLSYNRSRVPVHTPVSVNMENVQALEVLLHVLNMAGTDLIMTSEGQLAIVPSEHRPLRRGRIRGQVLDKETKAPLVGVSVSLTRNRMGATTDPEGRFLIEDVPVGSYTIQFNYIGYEPLSKTDVIVRSKRVTFLNVALEESPITMDEIVVRGGYFSEMGEQPLSAANFSAEEIRRAPGVMGDVSLIVRGLPGIAKVNDSFNSLIVRGGSAVENTFFVDNIEMPNISHFPLQGTSGGLLSLFNVDLVRDVNFYSGGFSAIYGDKLSSVMDLSFREGNREELDMQLDLHFAGMGGIAEGPLGGGKGSWLLSARRSFLDLLFDAMDEEGNVPRFSDYMVKSVYDLSSKHQVSVLGILGLTDLSSTRKDALHDGENEYGGVQWTQSMTGFNWRCLWGDNGYSNTSISHSLVKYDWNWFLTRDQSELFDNDSLEQVLKLRNVNYYRIHPSHKLEFGVEAKRLSTDYHHFDAPYNDPLGNGTPEFRLDENIMSQKYNAFVSYTWKPFRTLTLTSGLRADHFTYNGNTHISPRCSFSYQWSQRTSLNGAVGIFYQSLPLILLYQKDAFGDLKDPVAYHYVLGMHHLLTENTRLSIEVYDKEYDHFPLDPTQPSLFVIDQTVYQITRFTPHEQLVDHGKAYSRGIEVMLQKKMATHFYGLMSGTYFRSRYRDYDGVWRDRIYDNRYTFNIEGGYKPNHKWEFSARWTYAGGIPYTPYDIEASKALGRGVFDESKVNGERLPAYHSLNLRFDRRFHFSGSNLIFYLSIWNALNRQNIWHYQWNEIGNQPLTIKQFERTPIFGLEFEF